MLAISNVWRKSCSASAESAQGMLGAENLISGRQFEGNAAGCKEKASATKNKG